MKLESELKILYNRVKKNHQDDIVLVRNNGTLHSFGSDAEALSARLSIEIQNGCVRIHEAALPLIMKISPAKVVEYGKDNRGGYRRGAGKKKTLREGSHYVGFWCPPDLFAALGSKDRSKQIVDILYRELLPDE